MYDLQQYLSHAVSTISELNPGETFVVRDLFRGYQWNQIPRNERLLLGHNFANPSMNPALKSGAIHALARKTEIGQQQIYQVAAKDPESGCTSQASKDVQQLLSEAIAEIPNLQPGTRFLVKDLFCGYVWNRCSITTRRVLGKVFSVPSSNPELEQGHIVFVTKNTANQQIYEKV